MLSYLVMSVLIFLVMFVCSLLVRVKLSLLQIIITSLISAGLYLVVPFVGFLAGIMATYVCVCKFSSSPYFPDAFVFSVFVWVFFFVSEILLSVTVLALVAH